MYFNDFLKIIYKLNVKKLLEKTKIEKISKIVKRTSFFSKLRHKGKITLKKLNISSELNIEKHLFDELLDNFHKLSKST